MLLLVFMLPLALAISITQALNTSWEKEALSISWPPHSSSFETMAFRLAEAMPCLGKPDLLAYRGNGSAPLVSQLCSFARMLRCSRRKYSVSSGSQWPWWFSGHTLCELGTGVKAPTRVGMKMGERSRRIDGVWH